MIFWLFLTYGITLIITGSSIFRPIRQRDPSGLLRCPMCTGWWVGLGVSFAFHLGPAVLMPSRFMEALANAFCAAAWCWAVHVVLVRLGSDKL